MTIEGVDYAWDRPTVAGLVAAGKKFVIRYGGPGSAGKQLDTAELRALTAAGIAVVANAEGTASGFRGRTAGIAWARDAEAHFRGLGMPERPIYFSADWDVQSGQMDDVDAALRGAAEVIGAARVGLYGGYAVIRHAQAAGTARWFWQTYAWSGGRWAPGVHLQQYRNGVPLAGGTVDLCRATVDDYGQWGQPREEDEMAGYSDAQMRAFPWQYNGNGMPGVPPRKSTLWVLGTIYSLVEAIAKKVDIDPAELEQIRAAAREGAASAADGLVAAVTAKLPDDIGGMTRDQVVAAVEEGVRDAFAGGLAADAG